MHRVFAVIYEDEFGTEVMYGLYKRQSEADRIHKQLKAGYDWVYVKIIEVQ